MGLKRDVGETWTMKLVLGTLRGKGQQDASVWVPGEEGERQYSGEAPARYNPSGSVPFAHPGPCERLHWLNTAQVAHDR